MKTQFPGQELPSAVVDLYRFEGSCIVEHWDVKQERQANDTNVVGPF